MRWSDADARSLQPLVDLYLDIWIAPDGRFAVLDEDELVEAIREGHISEDRARRARQVLDDLMAAVKRGDFPTDEVKRFKFTPPENFSSGEAT